MSLRDQPLFTSEVNRRAFMPPAGASYIQGSLALEDRTAPTDEWLAEAETAGVVIISITAQSADAMTLEGGPLAATELQLRDAGSLERLLSTLAQPIFIDVTGLAHRTWAPLLRAATQIGADFALVYVEPATYTRSPAPAPGLIFDLSVRIEGISPLPGFARLNSADDVDSCFVPMLGFEGDRLAHMLESVQAPVDRTFPLIGVPGFRPEFPFYSYLGNRLQLESEHLHANVHFAKANCPFEAFHALHRIDRELLPSTMRIAPIGTKPHAIAAVLYALARPGRVELVYDHPVRKDRRTSGAARVCIYRVSQFVSTELFMGTGAFEQASGAP